MPHQDDPHSRSNLLTIKRIFEQCLPQGLDSLKRHGNATLEASWLAAVAIVCWGWTNQGTLGDRLAMACTVVGQTLGKNTTVSRQGLLKALGSCGDAMMELILGHLQSTLPSLKGLWTSGGKVNIAVDGSKMKAPRTLANQQEFSAANASKTYKEKSDSSKASTVQVLMTVFLHLGTGLPIRWKLAGSAGSERNAVKESIDLLPTNARLVGDAEYVGYPLWSGIIDSGRTFLFRVGSNITLLKNLGRFRARDGYVTFWPNKAMHSQQPPLVLRLFTIHNGKNTIYLVTNELDMSDSVACDLYKQRWGIEVFFRSVKQSCQRAKLCCGSPENLLTELNWTLFGIWCAMYMGKESIREAGVDASRVSAVKVCRAFELAVLYLSMDGQSGFTLADQLSTAVIVDESERTSKKRSRDYPRKKKHSLCQPPAIVSPTAEQRRRAKKLGF